MSMNRKQRRLQEKKLKKKSGQLASQQRLSNTLQKYQGNKEVERLHALGRDYLNKGDLVRATETFSQVLKLKPDHILTIEQMIVASQQLKRFDSAEFFLKALIEIDPEYARAYGYIGKFYMAQQNEKKALEYLNKGYEQFPDDPEILNALALVNYRSSNSEEADKFYRLAYEQEKNIVNLSSWMSATHKVKAKSDYVYNELLKFEKTVNALPRHQKPLLYSALAKANDQLKDYDTAFEYYNRTAQAIRKSVKFNIQSHQFLLSGLKDYFSKDFFENEGRALAVDHSKTPIFIVGMPRSGSTLIEQMLDSHPDICGVGESNFMLNHVNGILEMPQKENGVSFPIKNPATGYTVQKLATDYLAYLHAHNPNAQKYVDKALSNYMWLGIIFLAFPNAKIIHSKRNPLDSCISAYQQIFQNYVQEFSYDLTELGAYYKAYDDMMTHWHHVFPEKILDVQYENVVEDTEGQLRRILDFIDMPFDPRCLEYHKNQRFVFTASAGQINQPIYKTAVNKWKRYEKSLAPLVEALGTSAPKDSLYIVEKYKKNPEEQPPPHNA